MSPDRTAALFPDVRVAVIGDLMLDCYLHGDVARISPEAPVPVFRASHQRAVGGGAVNVAANLAALGIAVQLVGVTGSDEARHELLACINAFGRIDASGVIAAPDRRTTRKLRIVAAQQQIVRIDHEDTLPLGALLELECGRAAARAIDASDVVVLSDYGKGVCSNAIIASVMQHAASTGKKVLVDPKRVDFAAYHGASVLTPNRKELADATRMPVESDADAEAAAARASEISGADILLTRSEKGMSFFPRQGTPVHMPTVAQDVFDVSGAGDTVVAVLAAALGAGMPVVDAMRMANHAAGIVVSKVGTATVSPDELSASLESDGARRQRDGAIVSLHDATALRWRWASQRKTVGLACIDTDRVTFDVVQRLRSAAHGCDRLIALVCNTADAPSDNTDERAEFVSEIRGVAAVVLCEVDEIDAVVRALQPDVLPPLRGLRSPQHAQ